MLAYQSLLQVAVIDALLNRVKALEEKQKPSVASLKRSIVQCGFRQLSDFDKYKALEMVEELKNVAHQVKDKNLTILHITRDTWQSHRAI